MNNKQSDRAKLYSQVDKTDSEILCVHWVQTRAELLKELDEIQRKLAIVEAKLLENSCENILNGLTVEYKSFVDTERYNANWYWKEKAQYIIRKNNKPMSSSEITDEIFGLEFVVGETRQDAAARRRKIVTSVSGILADGTKNQVKNPAVFVKLDKINLEDNREQVRYWLAGQNLPSSE